MPIAIPMGEVSKTQGRSEASYPSGLTCQHPHHCDRYDGSRPRRQHHGRVVLGTGLHIRDGSWLGGFLSAVPHSPRFGILCHTSQEKLSLPTPLLASSRQNHGAALRSDRFSWRLLCPKGLSRKTAPRPLLRSTDQQGSGFFNQQLPSTAFDYRPALPLSLAGGTVFQVDQAASAYQSLLWHQRQCRENSDLDRHLDLRLGGHRQKALEPRSQLVLDSTSVRVLIG